MDLTDLSASYRRSASLIWGRVCELRPLLESGELRPAEASRLRARMALLRSMYSDLCATARYLENYYGGRGHG